MIIEKQTNEKTIIEFKHKIKDESLTLTTAEKISFHPAKCGSANLSRYDCWHDIERTEKVKLSKDIDNGFFILITNDDLFWTKQGTTTYGNDFDLTSCSYALGKKEWKQINEKSLGKKRIDPINIHQTYVLEYLPYLSVSGKNGAFKQLIVEI